MKCFKDFIPKEDKYTNDYSQFIQYISNKNSLETSANKYRLHNIKTESNSPERNDFFIAQHQRLNDYIKSMKEMLKSIDKDHQPIYKKMIGLRLRFFFFPKYNNNNLYYLFSEINDPLYEPKDLSSLLLDEPFDYLYLCILLVNFLNHNVCAKADSYTNYVNEVKKQLPETLLAFKMPVNTAPFEFAKDCPSLYYEEKDAEKIKNICEYLMSAIFPQCLEDCSSWILDNNDSTITNLPSYECYNHIASQFINMLFTQELHPTSYEAATNLGKYLLNNIKSKFFSVDFAYKYFPEPDLSQKSTEIDGLFYKYIEVMNEKISNKTDYIKIYDSLCKIYKQFLSYLSDNERYIFQRYYQNNN